MSVQDDVLFRAAKRSDLPKMAQLFTKRPKAEREARMIARYEQESSGWYVGVSGDEVVGCCQVVFPRPADAWLQWMRIAPNQQGGGIGGAFSDYIEQKALQGGARVVRLNTLPSNERVHYMMGGSRGFTEWVRWTRMTQLDPHLARSLAMWREVTPADDVKGVIDWLRGQVGYRKSFEAVTCPHDFRLTVSFDEGLVRDLLRKKNRHGVMVARADSGEIEAVALYAVRQGELRVLQVVAENTVAGLAATGGALLQAKPKESVSVQVAGCSAELVNELYERLAGKGSKRHDFYVFGKRF